MELGMANITASVIIVVVLAIAWRVLSWIWLRPKQIERLLRKQGLSGNSYRLLIGDAVDFLRMRRQAKSKPMEFSNDISSRVEPFLHQTMKNHGKNSFAWFGPIPMVVLTEAELVKEVLSRMSDFPKPNFKATQLVAPGVSSYEGDKWAKHRKLVNPAFHMEKLKLMLPAFHTSLSEMISEWEKLVSQTGSAELDVWSHLTSMTADLISRAAFSSSYKEGRKAFELIREQTQLITDNALELTLPVLRNLPTNAYRRFNKAQKGIQNIIESVIDKRRKQMEAGEESKDDLLGLLMDYSVETQQSGSRKQHLEITTEELIDECKLFYFAGQETTSILLTYTMVMLSKHRDWQERAREEILKTFGQNKPDFDGLNHLKTVTMILYEVLRLYPPLPTTARSTKNDTRVGDLFLPAGTFVFMPLIFTHQDLEYWGEEATEFKPERFSEGISKASKGGAAFLPFGWGPRICLGQNFGLNEAKMALAMILQRFSFELSPSYAHAPTPYITLQPQFGAQILLRQLKEDSRDLSVLCLCCTRN